MKEVQYLPDADIVLTLSTNCSKGEAMLLYVYNIIGPYFRLFSIFTVPDFWLTKLKLNRNKSKCGKYLSSEFQTSHINSEKLIDVCRLIVGLIL